MSPPSPSPRRLELLREMPRRGEAVDAGADHHVPRALGELHRADHLSCRIGAILGSRGTHAEQRALRVGHRRPAADRRRPSRRSSTRPWRRDAAGASTSASTSSTRRSRWTGFFPGPIASTCWITTAGRASPAGGTSTTKGPRAERRSYPSAACQNVAAPAESVASIVTSIDAVRGPRPPPVPPSACARRRRTPPRSPASARRPATPRGAPTARRGRTRSDPGISTASIVPCGAQATASRPVPRSFTA